MLIEAASALRRKASAGELRVEIAAQALNALIEIVADGIVRLADDEEIVSSALMLALTLGHTVPDCVYLALAEREGANLATADRRLGELAQQRGVSTQLVPSA